MAKGSMITLTSSDGFNVGCYHVAAQGDRKGGLVVIQEIFGVTDHIKAVCDSYAARGYEVLAPQLFDRIERDFNGGYTEREIVTARDLSAQTSWPHVVLDTQACVDALKSKGPVFMVGYCYGGAVCWVAACRCTGLSAVSGYYGRLIVDFLDEEPKCPIILHFGEHDALIPMENVDKIKAAHPNVPVYVYDAGHGFNSDRADHHDDASAALALERTLELFEAAEEL